MQRTFERILVPMDLSPTSIIALDHALYLAKKLNSEIYLLHVKETATVNNLITGLFKKDLKEGEKDTHIVESKFQDYIEEHQTKYGVKTHAKFLEGTVHIQVLNYAKEISAELICMGTHGSKGVENLIGGSNTFKVVMHSKCPVLSIHSDTGSKGIKDIILPLDSSRDTREKVDDALFFAKTFNSTIHVVGVSTSTDDTILNRLRVITKQVEDYINKDKVATTFGFITGKNSASLTLEYAKEKNADLIIIMTEQESSPGLLTGPYSQQMINESSIPVLSVRPKERETHFVNPY